MKGCYSIIICISIFNWPSSANKNSFDQAIKDLQKNKPELFEDRIEPADSKAASNDNHTYETLDKVIDSIALTSALIHICHCYYTLNTQTSDKDSTLNKIINYVTPSFIPSLHTKIMLIKEAGIITLETIIYKTIAKMVVYCAKGDFYDLMKKLLCKIKSIVL
ncbi:MAG: hypothetical protein M1114_05875 [Candidatus Dependentiae bacterium]|nr:hypothetical protein [Candidatus Dependentiae bacterium]